MKKSIYIGIIALATMLMTSCSNDEVYQSLPQDDAIEFGTYLGRDVQSRAAELATATLTNFGVFASYTNEADWTSAALPNFMFNQQVSRTDASSPWGYSPKKYWPTNQGDKISFFAYAPHVDDATTGITVKSASNAAGAPVITYSITADDLNTQADFVADVVMNETRTGGTTLDNADKTVSFNLLHELTRLGFAAKLDRDAYDGTDANQTSINIKSITFLPADEFCTSADYTFATVNDDNTTTPPTINRGTWSNFAGSGALDIANLLNTKTQSLGGYTTSGVLIQNNDDFVTLFKKNASSVQEYLFLIPRGKEGISAAGKVKIAIAYDIVTVDNKLSAGHSVTSATKIIEFPQNSLKQGMAYMFNLTFGLNEIKLDANVVDWETGDAIDGNVDWPKVDA